MPLRECLLREPKIDLAQMDNIFRVAETSHIQIKVLQGNVSTIEGHAVHEVGKPTYNQRSLVSKKVPKNKIQLKNNNKFSYTGIKLNKK